RLPRLTRFPYTTLFRSGGFGRSQCGPPSCDNGPPQDAHRGGHKHSSKDRYSPSVYTHKDSLVESTPENQTAKLTQIPAVTSLLEDRKSTRLNSSHQIIS